MDKAKAFAAILRDTAQSASNAIAGNVAGPVDLISAGLKGIGLPIPPSPMGGSQWMAEKGFMRDVPQGVPRVIGETMGMLGPSLAANFAPKIAAGINQMGVNAMAPRTMNRQTGAIVWHGSPHKFDAFDSSKIGTGEGVQAYGHGLYTADAQEVAKGYQKTLSADGFLSKNGQIFDPYKELTHPNVRTITQKGDLDAGIAQAQKLIQSGSGVPQATADLTKLQALKNAGGISRNEGYLYKMDLPDAHIAKMMDWDKPMGQQSKVVQDAWQKSKQSLPSNALDDLGGDLSLMYGKDVTPQDFLNTWESFGNRAGGESTLQQAGIPGIRYLDGASRGIGGTSNYVVFPGNEKMLSILERNGQAIK